MMSQVVNRVIGGTYGFNIVVTHETTGRECGIILQAVVASIIDFASSLWVQQLIDAEGRLQL